MVHVRLALFQFLIRTSCYVHETHILQLTTLSCGPRKIKKYLSYTYLVKNLLFTIYENCTLCNTCMYVWYNSTVICVSVYVEIEILHGVQYIFAQQISVEEQFFFFFFYFFSFSFFFLLQSFFFFCQHQHYYSVFLFFRMADYLAILAIL